MLTPTEQGFKKSFLPAIEAYWATRDAKQPHGCPVALKRLNDFYENFKEKNQRSMPSANKLGYADKRESINASIKFYEKNDWKAVVGTESKLKEVVEKHEMRVA